MSPFAFFCGLLAVVQFDVLDNALFICVALLLIEVSLFDGPAKVVDTALSHIKVTPGVQPNTPGSMSLFWVVLPLEGIGMVEEPAEVGKAWPAPRWYGPLAAARSNVVSMK